MKKSILLFAGACLGLATFAQAQDSCPTSVTLTAPVSGSKVVEQASEHLTASSRVQATEAAYRAGQSVTLTPGFEVKPGTVFEASIAACNTIPEASTVSINIIDVRGVIISRLLKEQKQDGGTHRITFESETLPSGVYICTLDTPGGRRTHKIVKQN